VYDSVDEDEVDGGGSMGSKDIYKGRAELVLVSPSDLYSDDNKISVCDNRPSSCLIYTFY